MKRQSKVLTTLTAVLMLVSLNNACSSKSDNKVSGPPTNGIVGVSGTTTSTSDTVQGQPINVSVSNISLNGQTLQALVNVNGTTANIYTYIVTPQNYNGAQIQNVGSYTVYSTARCLDNSCMTTGLVLWVTPYSQTAYAQQLLQFGIKANGPNLTSAMKYVGYISGYGNPVLQNADALLSSF